MRILIAEDQRDLNQLLKKRLKEAGYSVDACFDGAAVFDYLLGAEYDALVLDIMMPKVDGIQVVRRLRREGNQVPVLLLTAKQSFEDKREGFSSGIDDYMTKPVNYEELIWRLDALLRRAHIASEQKIVVGRVVLDSSTYTVRREEKILELPRKEFELLYKLLSYPGQIFTRNQLLDGVWGYDSESGEDTVKTHISRLRNKLRDIPEFRIVTIKGLGYKAEITKEEGA